MRKNCVTIQDTSQDRRRGRPQELSREEREARILDAAERLFSEDPKGASMDAIAHAAGMSKRTLYEVFDSRIALFEGVIRRIRSSFLRTLNDGERELPLRERLMRVFEPQQHGPDLSVPLALLRTIIIETPRHPELGETLLREGMAAGNAYVADVLREAVHRGEINVSDPALAAEILADMVCMNPLEKLLSPVDVVLEKKESTRRLEAAVDIFLGGVSAKP